MSQQGPVMVVTDDIEERVKRVTEKFKEIHTDLAHNVTRIYGRDDVLIAADLVFHSVMSFVFLGEMVRKGWAEVLVLGDTGCGKTKTITSLLQHYRAGELCTGEGATFAGLVGGAQQIMGKVWSITWGMIPLMDRRLLVIDEASGLSVDEIADMSGLRSEGIAQLVKIQQEKTFARTRLIWISNPRRPQPLWSYNTGVDAVRELIGRPEDIRRFDFAITVASNEVPTSIINRRPDQEKVPNRYTSKLCHDRVRWAWSRKPEQILITPEAEEHILVRAEEMGKTYHASIPLVEPADQRLKIARLAVAAAARVFSTDESGERVIVGPEHVEFICRFLADVYKKRSLGYDLYSRQRFADETLANENEVLDLLAEQDMYLVDALLDSPAFMLSDFELICGLERADAKDMLSKLVRNRALKKGRAGGFFKTPAFIELLKTVKEDGLPTEQEKSAEDEPAPF